MVFMATNPNNYLLNKTHPLFQSRLHLHWTNRENETLKQITQNLATQPNLELMSMSIPGRNGRSVREHYHEMVSQIQIELIQIQIKSHFGDITHRIFLLCYEEILASFIAGSFMDGVQMDFDFIKKEAIELYYTPYVIAERITDLHR